MLDEIVEKTKERVEMAKGILPLEEIKKQVSLMEITDEFPFKKALGGEDISIMGYDNIALSRFVEPKLTTVDQNMLQLGTDAVTVLIDCIKGASSRHITLQNEIIERDSTGPCKE